MTRLVLLIVIFAAVPGGASANGPAPEAPPISFVVRTQHFDWRQEGLVVPGYGFDDAPGAPRLPVHYQLVELPAGTEWSVTYEAPVEQTLASRFRIPAVPAPLVDENSKISTLSETSEMREVERPDPAIYSRDAFYPTVPVLTGQIQRHKEKLLLPVRVFPFQYNPISGVLLYRPEIKVILTPGPAGAARASAFAVTGPSLVPSSGEQAVRIRIRDRGMYRITYDDLVAAQVPAELLAGAAPSFHMTILGQPTQIQVVGTADGSFDPGDFLIFYAEPYVGRYMTDNVYWLYFGGDSVTGATMDTRSVPAGTAAPTTVIRQAVHIEKDLAYLPGYPMPTDADHYLDETIYPSASVPVVSKAYSVLIDDPVTDGELTFTGLFYGGQDAPSAPDQSLVVSANGASVGSFQWDGRVAHSPHLTAPASVLHPGANDIAVEGALSQLPGIAEYWVYPDWFEIDYPALADTENDRLWVKGVESDGTELQLVASGFTLPDVLVYDIRHPLEVVQLTTVVTVANEAGTAYDVTMWDSWSLSEPPPQYYLTTAEALLPPVSIELDTPSDWAAPHDADYIAVVHSSLAAAVRPLLDHRRAEGMSVAEVDIQDIYDEFSNGLAYPPAIRTFLANAYNTWNTGRERPKYVLLVGDGHFDFKGVTGTKMPNLIPPYLMRIDPFYGETAADNRYASIDGPDDYLPDMAIGRLPAVNASQVTGYVNKVLAYEDAATTPDGDWQSRTIYVADNPNDQAGNFHALSDDVRLNWLPPQYEDKTLYYLSSPALDTGEEVRAAIKGEYNQGAMYLQWFGHANSVRWGTVSMYNINDPATLQANSRIPFVAHYSCWTGYFIDPKNPYGTGQSVAEVMTMTEGRSTIGDLAPTGQHVGSALSVLDKGLTLAIFRDREHRLGDAVDAARLYYFGNTSAFPDVIDTSTLFGDPAVKLRVPPTPPTAATVSIRLTTPSSITLDWDHELDSSSYEVWRSTSPYFEPAPNQGTQVRTVQAGFRGVGQDFPPGFSSEDDGSTPEPPVAVVGDTTGEYFWVIKSRNGDGTTTSNRVGAFDFSLVAGDPGE